MLGDEFDDFKRDGRRLDVDDSFSSGRRRLDMQDETGGRRLGQDDALASWDYHMLPNKSLELVKNVGNMQQEGTGYFMDSESEMLKVLAYLNYGETTGITESMMEQIDEAVKNLENMQLRERDEVEKDSFIHINF